MTYVRHQFNDVTDMVVTEEMVADARARFGDQAGAYTVAELSGADVMLPGDQPDWMNPAGEAEGGDGGDAPAEDAGENAAEAAPAT